MNEKRNVTAITEELANARALKDPRLPIVHHGMEGVGMMRISKVSVKGLFGKFDHEIPLNQESRITIIHGPNGVGKTVTLLELVQGLFNYDYELLGETPFDEFRS